MDGSGTAARQEGPDTPLFREAVLRERQSQWLGAVQLKPRATYLWFGAASALVTVLLLGVLCLGSYTKKARVSGWLVPVQGVAQVHAPRAAVATRVFVREGDKVVPGQPLVALSTEERSAALGDTQARVIGALALQRDSLAAEAASQGELAARQRASLAARLAALRDERQAAEREIALQQSRVATARQWEQRLRELQKLGFVLEQHVRGAADDALEQATRLQASQRSLLALERERATLEGELREVPLRAAAQQELVRRNIAVTTRELAETEARRALAIPAPQAGIVSAVQVTAGTALAPGAPLLSIVPGDARLEAHLYAPSRAVGFVRPGQRVLLRYRAYPYQKFGHYRGTIRAVSRSAIEPAALPPMFAGPAGLQGEALYRIVVTLERQDVTAYGRPVALQAGSQLDADVLLESRRLVEWALEPLFTLTGNLR